MTERSFGGSRQVLRASWAKRGEAHQPTQGLCAPPQASHAARRVGAPLGQPAPSGLGGKAPRGGHPNPSRPPLPCGRHPLGETLGAPPLLPSPYI